MVLHPGLGKPYLFEAVLVMNDHSQEIQGIYEARPVSGLLLGSLGHPLEISLGKAVKGPWRVIEVANSVPVVAVVMADASCCRPGSS